MDRYQRVERPKPESPIQENEIRITTQGLVRNYVSYGVSLLQDKHAKEITLKAMGQAINKAVAVAEFLKKQFPTLHQDTAVSSVSLTDVWEPIEEGLLPVETTRQVSMISITLSTKEMNKSSPGYQAPNHAEESRTLNQQQQPRQAPDSYNAGYDGSYGQGRERGRGRGRGWGRGYGDYYQDNRGYSDNWGQGQIGRGRNFYRGDNYNQIAYDEGYDQGHGGGYEQGRGGGHERGRRGGGFQRGRVGGYERSRGDGNERGRGGGYDRGRGSYARVKGDYEQGQSGGYRGGRGGAEGYGRSRGGYARGRGGGYVQGHDNGYDEGQEMGGVYGRSRGGYARGREGYERARGGYGRGHGRSGGRSRGGGY